MQMEDIRLMMLINLGINKENIFLIEDAAQSLGSKYPDGTSIGSKGNIDTLYFLLLR